MLRAFRDLSVTAKGFAVSGLVLLGLMAIGIQANRAMNRSNAGLHSLIRITIPKQRAIKDTIQEATSSHVDLFRLVSWSSNGVNPKLLDRLSTSLTREVDRVEVDIQGLLATANTTKAEAAAIERAKASWKRYAQAARDVIDIAVGDPALGTMMLGAADEEYRKADRDLEATADLVAAETASQTGGLVARGTRDQNFATLAALAAGILALLATSLLIRSILGPIGDITRAMGAVSQGGPEIELAGAERKDEIGKMVRAIRRFRKRLRERESDLRTQNYRFQVLTDHMIQAVSLFDSEQRLIIMNRRYAEMFRLPEELTRPGVTLREIREFRVKAGCSHVGDKDRFINGNLTGSTPRGYVSELADGRFISFRSMPMADHGWVGTHEDVTELHKAQQAVADQRARLETALQNMSQGLAMFDREGNLIICNERYAELYGLPPDLTVSGTAQREILEYCIVNRFSTGADWDEYLLGPVSNSVESQLSDRTFELRDGRVIAVSYRPMPNGGSVSTHEDITERRKAEARIAHMARYDDVTDLPNRVFFRERIAQALTRVRRQGEALAVLCVDLDHFKAVNDTLGHPIGDLLLGRVAQRLKDCLRETDTVARLGGDEFAMLQVGAEQPHHAGDLARRIVEVISAPYDLNGNQVVIGASIGISVAPEDGVDADHLLKKADMALYRAKGEGRGNFHFFEPEMDAIAQSRREMELELRKALGRGEFELFYQPVVSSHTCEVSSFEALIRWRHPNRERVSPAEFIPLAEEIGLIVPIGEWVLRQACAEAARWPDHIKVAVNLSPVQFGSKKLLQAVVGALSVSGLAPHRLELEITEAVLLEQREATLDILRSLRQLGVSISIDDFGTGYSSLSYLRSFPFDKIKIDQSFVQDIGKRTDAAAIIRAVTGLGISLGVSVVGEGVETEEQFEYLRQVGCGEIQGYLVSPPVPAAELHRLLPTFGNSRMRRA